MDAGQTLLENGGEVFRAQQTMEIMAASLGVRDFHVYVLTNGIFASAHLPGRDAVSLVRHVPTVSVHLGRVEAVNELSRELAAGRLGVVEAEARLNTARTLPRSTPQLEILACVVGAAGFAYLFGGTLADMPVAAVAGLLEALTLSELSSILAGTIPGASEEDGLTQTALAGLLAGGAGTSEPNGLSQTELGGLLT